MVLRITTWNVNGIRNPFSYEPWRKNRTFQAMFDTLEADIVVMQETKIQRKDLRDDMVLVPGWDVYFSLPKYKKGYSGVAIYTRSSKCCPIKAEEGITGVLCPPNSSTKFRDLPTDQQIGGYPTPGQLSSDIDEAQLDSEGRCVVLEFPAFVLIGVYSPATRDETRTEFRQAFIDAMDARVRNLVAMGKEVFLCGDLNIIRNEMDTAGLPERLKKEAMTLDGFFSTPSRRFLNQMVFGGRVIGEPDEGREKPVLWDLCREFHPRRPGMYTCWETRKNARPGNFGSRIDYVLCSSGIKDWFIDANIQEGLLGSDHCPVYATIGDTVSKDGSRVPITEIMNPEGMFKDGQRQREWSQKDCLPTSAKLIQEFDRRQSIKDMFFKKRTPSTTPKAATPAAEGQDAFDPANISFVTSTAAVPVPETASFAPSPKQSLSQSTTTEPALSQTSPLPKRRAEQSASSIRPPKKAKMALTKQSSSKAGPGPSQSTLIGFFKPKTSTATLDPAPINEGTHSPAMTADTTRLNEPSPTKESKAKPPFQPDDIEEWDEDTLEQHKTSATTHKAGHTAKEDENKGKPVFDPIQNKESWSKLLGKRVVPKCEHGDDCQSLVTKKPGINCGRSFYMCARPLGPSGDKETGTEFRCKTFIWSSDWNGRP
ncbi:Endonuclease/exonuclease/phosphatase [Sordaria brevicollis]|uniref:DNA-(apurinic or apyrimidinic site) endonuclease 2 n=1 Tax=Sordaria brevicollis TaxID=83679 RepID=A0AAE0UA17_SORBR|nr:Endonuclease/exonuclease/phosphatase [Sordaria brevicollis]